MNKHVMKNGDIEVGDYVARITPSYVNIVWIITEQCNLGCPYCIGTT